MKQRNKPSLWLFKNTLLTLFTLLISFQVSAGLVLNPQRIVLQDRERSASLDLLNTDDKAGRYQIYFE
ncbi:hypothetical protein, partial [Oleiphilus sp. HI0123]